MSDHPEGAVPFRRYTELMGEVEHRAELFARHYASVPYSLDESPMAAALRSVTADVERGWL